MLFAQIVILTHCWKTLIPNFSQHTFPPPILFFWQLLIFGIFLFFHESIYAFRTDCHTHSLLKNSRPQFFSTHTPLLQSFFSDNSFSFKKPKKETLAQLLISPYYSQPPLSSRNRKKKPEIQKTKKRNQSKASGGIWQTKQFLSRV